MSEPQKLTAADHEERKQRAAEWKQFRKVNLLTQVRLGDVINVSRRTIQQVEAGRIVPHPETLRKFISYRNKCEANVNIDRVIEWTK